MFIRKARDSDVEEISKLAKSISFSNIKEGNKGFLVYTLSKKEYLFRIKISNHFYVSEDNHKINGFLMCYDSETLKNLLEEKTLTYEDKIVRLISQMPKPFIFGDQIGVSRQAQKQNFPIGISLMNKLFEDMKKQGINTMYVAILHKPKLNLHSQHFCRRIDFKQIDEVMNKDNTLWGIYKYTI